MSNILAFHRERLLTLPRTTGVGVRYGLDHGRRVRFIIASLRFKQSFRTIRDVIWFINGRGPLTHGARQLLESHARRTKRIAANARHEDARLDAIDVKARAEDLLARVTRVVPGDRPESGAN